MKKLFLLFIFLPAIIWAQTKTVKGTVKDNSGMPLPGVTLLVKNSKNLGATTDFDGNFNISIPSNQTQILVFSYLGFATQEIDVTGINQVNVLMIEDQTKLDEVVVVGYGTVKKSDLTGAVTSVVVDDIVARQSNTIDQLLQGRAAGVQVTQNLGSPGSGISVQIRGRSSLRGNTEPLYVVDGVIISSAGEDAQSSGGINNISQESQSGLNGINPRDIESMEILKDASATAIYGSRGANGVVLITTKKGKSNKTSVNLFSSTGIRSIDRTYDVLESIDYVRYRNESASLRSEPEPYVIQNNNIFAVNTEGDLSISDTPSQSSNYQEDIFKDMATSFNIGGSVAGGTDKGNYYVSFGYDDQNGLTDNARFQSGNFRANLNQEISDKLEMKVTFSTFYGRSSFGESGGDNAGAGFVNSVINSNPIFDGEFDDFAQDLGISNPYSWIDDFQDISKETRYIGSINLDYKLPVKGLVYEVGFGGNIRQKDRRRFWGLTTFQGSNTNGALGVSNLDVKSYQLNNLLKYNRTFNEKHNINAVAGVTYDVRKVRNSIYAVQDFTTPIFGVNQPAFGQLTSQPNVITYSDQQILSYLARVNYSFDSKYVFTASVRTDGVSKFSKENRFSTFPSFALAWNAHNEGFLENSNFLNELKIRAGWGQIGNHGIGPYGTLPNLVPATNPNSFYATPGEANSIPVILSNIPNPDLKWETTEQINLGIDFGLLKNRITGSVDAYSKDTKDLLQNAPIPLSSGFSSLVINRGVLSNKGLELSLNGNLVSKGDFNLSIGGNIALNRNKIESLGIPLSDLPLGGMTPEQKSYYFGSNVANGGLYFQFPANIFIEGEEVGLFYGYETNGIYQTEDTDILSGAQAGDIRYIDQNEDGVIDANDRTIIGNPNPDFTYGFNLSFDYKRFSGSLLFNGVYGNDIANGNSARISTAEGNVTNILSAAYFNAWRPDAQSNQYPRINSIFNPPGGAMADRIIEDGSFLRLANVTIGYDIPAEKVFDKLRIYLSAQNLFTITNYSGYNPEVTSFLNNPLISGVDWSTYPNAKNVVLGLDINF